MRRAAAIATLVLSSAGGCASAAPIEGPEQTLDSYVAALRSGDAAAVYALLDQDTKDALTVEELAAVLADNRQEAAEQADALDATRDATLAAEARVPTRHGETVVLLLEDGSWKLLGGVLGAPALRTPRDAVLALRRALERRSLPGVLRVLSRGTRAELETEMDRLLEDTEDELGLDYEIQGNEAVVTTSTGRRIVLSREAGEWRVVEVE